MKTLLILLLFISTSVKASLWDSSEMRPIMADHSRIYVIHNRCDLEVNVELNGTVYASIKQGTTEDVYIPPGYSGYVIAGASTWNPSDWQSISPKPFIMHVYVHRVSGGGYTVFAPPAVKIPNPHSDFLIGFGLGCAAVAVIAVVRVARRTLKDTIDV
jgi:hypothetical protein